MTKLTPAQKSAQTRKARNDFEKKYGPWTFNNLVDLMYNKKDLSTVTDVQMKRSLSTTKGNLTHGTYKPFVKPDFTGTCNLVALL